MRLLSELFPNFVKKSQIERLDKGPFGEGLDASELKKEGLYDNIHAKRKRGGRMRSEGDAEAPTDKDFRDAAKTATKSLTKARTYLKPGEEPPQGVKVQSGPKGGRYYEEGGSGGGPSIDPRVTPVDAMGNPRREDARGESNVAAEYFQRQKRLNNNIATKEGQLGRKLTNDESKRVFEATMAAEAQGVEADEDALPMSILRPSPEGLFEGDVSEPAFDGDVSEVTYSSAEGDTMSPSMVEELRAKGELDYPTFDGPRNERGDPHTPSVPVFDGQGNVHLAGYDPYPIAELDWEDAIQGGLLEQYTAETGGSLNSANMFLEGGGSLNQDYLEEVIEEQTMEESPSYRTDYGWEPPSMQAIPEMEYAAEKATDELRGFFDWLNSKSGTETMKMAKMMQTYNVDIKKRDPIVIANKGGNQRRNAYVKGIYKK